MNLMKYLPPGTITLLLLSLFLFACNNNDDDEITQLDDYREEWVGTYEGTKSNRSIEDTVFTTPITFEVSINDSSLTELIINGRAVPISDEGTFGPAVLEGSSDNYEVVFSDDGNIKLIINEIFPNGIALPCYINATRI